MRTMLITCCYALAAIAVSAAPAYAEAPAETEVSTAAPNAEVAPEMETVATIFPVASPIAPTSAESAPDALLSAATLIVTNTLKEDRKARQHDPEAIADLIESTILPLFDFRHMTRLAMAQNWRLASPEQQSTIVAEFRALLVRTYSTALANYSDHEIIYKPLRIAPGETDVTVRSTVKQPGAERMTFDYDMERMTTGWKVYDLRIAGISLSTIYRAPFAETVRDDGVDGLIRLLAAKNRESGTGTSTRDSGAWALLFLYQVAPGLLRSRD